MEDRCWSMSLEKNYALVKDGKIDNIILCTAENIAQFSEDSGMDSFVELTDENYYKVASKAKIGDWVDGTSFVWSSWTKNEDGTFTSPIAQPNDGRVYEWREEDGDWVALTPYPSWSWDPETRVASAPHRSPSGLWKWNEDRLDWDPVENPIVDQDGPTFRWPEEN